MSVQTYRDLDVFKEGYRAALDLSKLTKRFPAVEQVELGRQLRKAARPVPPNIAEGWAKRVSLAEFRRDLQVAIGSCDKARMWLEMSKDEGYVSMQQFNELTNRFHRIGAMLRSLWRNWRNADH